MKNLSSLLIAKKSKLSLIFKFSHTLRKEQNLDMSAALKQAYITFKQSYSGLLHLTIKEVKTTVKLTDYITTSDFSKWIKASQNYFEFKLNNYNNAVDIICDVNLQIIEKLHTYNPEKGSFKAWINTIKERSLVDFYREKKEKNALFQSQSLVNEFETHSEERFLSETLNPFDALVRTENNLKIYDLLEKIKSKNVKAVIIAYYIDGLSFKEIAQNLNLDIANIRVMAGRGLKTLKELV